MKLRGKPDPFAYIPLNLNVLNKRYFSILDVCYLNCRKAAKTRGQFNNIVRAVNRNKK